MSEHRKVTRMLTGRKWNSGSFPCIHQWIRVAFALAAMAVPRLGHAESVALHFDTFAPKANVTNVNNALGPGYTGGLTMDFLDVATYEGTTIDARVTAVARQGAEFATGTTNKTARGYIPNYKATTRGQPNGDLGFLYAVADGNTAGITLTILFFDGTGDRSGTFSEAYVVPDLRLLIYDVDGEPAQAEWFDAYYADGLHSHTTGTATASVTATPTATGVHFVGPGKDVEETDTSGAVLLQYRDTSQITLAFGADQYEEGMNPVFSAIDGDVSLSVKGDFQAPTVAPAPPVIPAPILQTYSASNAIRLDRLAPAEVTVNVPFDYTLTVTNTAGTPLYDVVVLERLPGHFQLHSSDPRAQQADGNLSWTVGSLDPQASREIRVSGVATAADNVRPCATVTFVAPPFCADIAVVEPQLTLTMAVPQEALVCDPIELQFVVTNQGTGAAKGVQIVHTLPIGLRTTDDKTELVLDVGALAPGQSYQSASSLKAASAGEYVISAVATAQGGLKAEATATTIVRQPVLTIAKTGPAREYIDQPITYEITVTNEGNAPAANAVVEDVVPQGAKGIQTSPAGNISGSRVVWQLGTLAAGASKKVSITYTPTGAGVLAETATVTAVCANTVTATAETTVYGIAAVLLEVIDTDDPVRVGGQTTYLITATNQGSSPNTNVQITAAVEDAQEIAAATGPTQVTVDGSTARSAPLAALAPGAKATWQITVKALRAGDVRFRATMTTAELERIVEETEATQLYE